jgi:hypothetical protein
VLRVARGAAGLFDVLFDHGDNGMIRQPPFTRTVIIQYVTETQPALLHSHSPEVTVFGLERNDGVGALQSIRPPAEAQQYQLQVQYFKDVARL